MSCYQVNPKKGIMLDFIIKTDRDGHQFIETSLSGKPLLTTPQLNKGTAFSALERKIFELTGKLPAYVETLEEQVNRAYLQYQSYPQPLQKNTYLNNLHDTNQTLFYKLVENHEQEMIPILYTPTVSIAVEKFSSEFQQARGLYICYEDRFRIEEILNNRSNPEIDLIVASDGGGVLGIGDQGVGAMLIPVAKLMVYTICGGINPLRTLPILLDVGTNNSKLLTDPFYLGWRHPRISGDPYDEFIELFVRAVKKKFLDVFLQWEDFGRDNARKILEHYRTTLCSFNDDIQGTGATTLAALLAAVKSLSSSLTQQKIMIFGAGSAGTGIADQLCQAMMRMGLSLAEARSHFWLIDKPGLLIDSMTDLTEGQKHYARPAKELKNCSILSEENPHHLLAAIIEHVKPTVLIGCSAQKNAFTQEAIETMAKHTAAPIIFPLSNPPEKIEGIPENLIAWTKGTALIATGSPFEPVLFEGTYRHIAQCNNALIFPGIGLGIIAAKAKQVTENMLWAACMALNQCAPIHQDSKASLLPNMAHAKTTAKAIAIAVAKQARQEGVAGIPVEWDIAQCVADHIWTPGYLPLKRK